MSLGSKFQTGGWRADVYDLHLVLLLSGAQQHPGVTAASWVPERPSEEWEAGDPAEQSGLAAEDTDHSGSASVASVQDLILPVRTSVSVTLPPGSVEAGSRSPENVTFTAGRNPSVQEIQGGSGEEPNLLVSATLNMTHRSPEGSGGASGGGWPEPTDLTPPTGTDEAVETVSSGVKMTRSPHQTFTATCTPESSSPAAQEASSDGESSSSPAVTEEPEEEQEEAEEEQEEQEEEQEEQEQEEQQLSSVRISGGFNVVLFFFFFFLYYY